MTLDTKQHDKKILKSSAGIMATQWAGLFLRFGATLIAARLVEPEEIGYVAWLGIWPIYASWLTLGVPFGAGRLIPVRRGEGRLDETESMRQSALGVTLLVMAGCIVIGGMAGLVATGFEVRLRWKLAAAGMLCASTLFNSYVSMILVADKRFKLMAFKQIVEGVLWWCLLPLALVGLPGLTMRLLIVSLLSPILFFLFGKCYVPPALNGKIVRELIRNGWIIMVVGFLVSLAFAFDRTLIAFFMNDEALGFYMIAFLVISLIQPITVSLGRVLYPNLGEHYGENRDIAALAVKALRPIPVFVGGLLPFVIAGYYLAEPMTRFLLPRYLPGVPAARIVLLAAVFAPLFGSYVFYNVVKRQKDLVVRLICGLIVQTLVSFVLYSRNPSIESFAWGMVAGFATSAVLLVSGIICSIFSQRTSSET